MSVELLACAWRMVILLKTLFTLLQQHRQRQQKRHRNRSPAGRSPIK